MPLVVSRFFRPRHLYIKLLRVVFSLYLCVTVGMTVAHFTSEYMRTQNALLGELKDIGQSVYPSIATSLWQINHAQLAASVDGLLVLPSIEGVDVLAPDGSVILSRRSYENGAEPLEMFSIQEQIHWSLREKEINLGIVKLYSSSSIIFDRVIFGFYIIIVNAFIKILILWFLFIWAFKRFLGRPLRTMTEQIDDIALESIENRRIQLGVSDPNELNKLQTHVNQMLGKMERDRAQMLKAEKDKQAWLEAEVAQRTAELVRLNKELEQIALTDALTGVHSRRSYFEQSQALMDLAARKAQPLAVIAVDLDHFKRINDTYGHAVGDEVLKHFTSVVSGSLRSYDVFGRIGGEEFAITLPQTDLNGAQGVANKVCKQVALSPLSIDGITIYFTVSLGVVLLSASDKTVSDILKRGDSLLYAAKEKGRNRVEVQATEQCP